MLLLLLRLVPAPRAPLLAVLTASRLTSTTTSSFILRSSSEETAQHLEHRPVGSHAGGLGQESSCVPEDVRGRS